MAERLVRHAMVDWTEEEVGYSQAFRGEYVDTDRIPPARLAKLEMHGAFAAEDAEENTPPVDTTHVFNPSFTDEEMVAWVKAATVDEIVEAGSTYPNEANRLLDAEQDAADDSGREPRKGVEKGLASVSGK